MLKWITLAPLIGAAINGFFGKRLGERAVSIIAPASVFVSFVLAVLSFNGLLHAPANAEGLRQVSEYWFTWIQVGTFQADFAYLLDPLSGVYILFVTFVGFLIHVYATGYMHGDPGYYRFFAYLNLFMFMMLTLVLADNLLLLFVGWEGVGLCSYLLIGYYIRKKEAGDAAKKAFVANRIGDLSFMIGLFVIFTTFGSISFVAKGEAASFLTTIATWAPDHLWVFGTATVIALLLFGGATGKSAQIPLYVWLPDAMAGPTPVSALIHAATMVTAGVYLTARCSAVVVKSPTAMVVIAVIGAATAIFAATIGLAQNDIKKVLAYSTVSQLGYMFLACGTGYFIAGIFHVMTHAFFKALLFLGSGSVIHGMHHEQDMRYMGNLKKYMKVTWATMLVGWLAISGFPFLSGFFSKDEILWRAFSTEALPSGMNKVLWGVAALTALLTAVYMTRMMVMTFWGDERYDGSPVIHEHDAHSGHGKGKHGHFHPHESPWVMTLPLVILAVLSVAGGWVGWPAALGGANHFEHFLEPAIAHVGAEHGADNAGGAVTEGSGAHGVAAAPKVEEPHDTSTEVGLTVLSVVLGLLGIGIGWTIFKKTPLKPMPALLENKWYVDELYDATLINPIENTSRSFLWKIVDVKLIDGFVNGVANAFSMLANVLRTTQTGFARNYAAVILMGAIVVIGYFALR
ncbi:MAG: NADH-quinone oxidoreductase subunit L [Acidobacteria bacterium]|nr:NADH-quinone oxidoreductase subunit L [Acidobacteriota bacterium]MBI3425631.1 NADH-quinone oxidoreductase subunit L [Acidobacteriota bacterium]